MGTKILKQINSTELPHHVQSWFEVIAQRKCQACGSGESRTKTSTRWNDGIQNEEAQKLEVSFQRELDILTMALNGNTRIDNELKALQDLIRRTYQEMWLDWFTSTELCSNAALLVWESANSSGYHRDLDTIEITIQSATPDGFGALRPETWPSWKCELVHEMLHELEAKTRFFPSDAGVRLFRDSRKTFPNHPPEDFRFFTAIVDKAENFGLTPEKFLELL